MSRKSPADSTAKQDAPAFQMYPGDWLTATLGMPWDAKGVYFDLLCWAWINGPLPDDPAWRQRLIGGSPAQAARLWATIRARWRRTKRGWVNPRLERQRKVQAAFRAHATAAARARWNEHESGINRASIEHESGIDRASPRAVPKRSSSSSSSSSSSKDHKPAAPRPVHTPPFKVYAAIASKVIEETEDLGLSATDIDEEFKRECARQGLLYHARIVQKAMDAARDARSRRHA